MKTFINKSTETADGKKVMLAANIGGADEAAKAVKAGAEGVGLFRTEFLFLIRMRCRQRKNSLRNIRRRQC